MRRPSTIQNLRVGVCPLLHRFELFNTGVALALQVLKHTAVLFHLVESDRRYHSGSEDSCDLCSQKMSLLARERWVRLYVSVKVASHHVFNQSGEANVLRFALGKLNPIVE